MSEHCAPQPAGPPSPAWSVWRIDDNGNRFLLRDDLTDRGEAERIVAEFTARGHKQVYWAEPPPLNGPTLAAAGGAPPCPC